LGAADQETHLKQAHWECLRSKIPSSIELVFIIWILRRKKPPLSYFYLSRNRAPQKYFVRRATEKRGG